MTKQPQITITNNEIRVQVPDLDIDLYWDEEEWRLDPSLTPTLCEVVMLALTKPHEIKRRLESAKRAMEAKIAPNDQQLAELASMATIQRRTT